MKSVGNILSNIFLAVLVILAVVSFFWKKAPPAALTISAEISMQDATGETITWGQFVAAEPDFTALFLRTTDCETCIYKGMNRVTADLDKAETSVVIVVDNWQEEVNAWSYHYQGIPIFRIAGAVFEKFDAPGTPLWVTMEEGSVIGFDVITTSGPSGRP